MDEPHVEHAVGFVKNQKFHVFQGHRLLPQVIQKTPRRRNEEVHAAGKGLNLRIDADAAEDERGFKRRVGGVRLEVFVDLRREFAGRSEDQGTHVLGRALFGGGEHRRQNGQRKRRGFPGACLGGRQDVAAL